MQAPFQVTLQLVHMCEEHCERGGIGLSSVKVAEQGDRIDDGPGDNRNQIL